MIESHIGAFLILNVPTEKCATVLYPLIESCMQEFLRACQRSSKFINGAKSKNSLYNLMEFLKYEEGLEIGINLALTGSELKPPIKKRLFQWKKEYPLLMVFYPLAKRLLNVVCFISHRKQVITVLTHRK